MALFLPAIPDEHVDAYASRLVNEAKTKGQNVKGEFNGCELTATPRTAPVELSNQYFRFTAWVNDPSSNNVR